MLEVLVDVGREGLGPDKVRKCGARCLESRSQIFTNLPDLHAHIAFADNLAILVAREQPQDENEFAGHYRDYGRVE